MISITGSTCAGVAVAPGRRSDGQARRAGARRQVAERDPAGRRSRSRRFSGHSRCLPQPRPVVQCADAYDRAARAASRSRSIAKRAADEIVVGNPPSETTTHGAIANRAQFDRIQTMIGVGISEARSVVTGGQGRPGGLNAGLYVKPTIFSEVRTGMRIAQEEIFGPVFCIIPARWRRPSPSPTTPSMASGRMSRAKTWTSSSTSRRRSAPVKCISTTRRGIPARRLAASGNPKRTRVRLEGMLEYLEVKSILGYF